MLAAHFMYKTVLWAEIFLMKAQKTNIFKQKWSLFVLAIADFKRKRSNSIHENEKS